MKYRQLSGADLRLSLVGMGCASFWGKSNFSEKHAIEVFAAAAASGINYYDTGSSYSGGHAEQRLGRALHAHPDGKDAVISSKAGTRIGRWGKLYNDFSPAWIRQSCENSLRHLQIDHIPIFFLHGPNPEDFTAALFEELEQLQKAGKIGLIGVNAFAEPSLQSCFDFPQIQCIMLDFNIYQPQRCEMIKQFKAAGKNVFVAGALAGAIYDDRFWRFQGRKSLWYWLRAWKNNPQLKAMKKQMKFLNDSPNLTATQLALAYVLNNPDLSTALVGSTRVEHMQELLQAVDVQLEPALIKRIESQAQQLGL
ncbi:aldo/keto reductase [Marinicella sp. S1101]|uniref:aldo/keto reductase n=1 Tax=Marinicella marina TaxID=2996016 RepID=UPI002260EE26|nr:aldo/keto reductase [Marinicella marina]MCX7554043.1 aldo/keto reductase [Marinicella marina]MDJ1140535.1 aldo/keto reductase [Marinicella marina]